jgi:hypothetical protein
MSLQIHMRLENGPAMQRALQDMIPKEARKIARSATGKAAVLWKQDVKRRIQGIDMSASGKKQYASTIIVKTKSYSAKGIYVAIVGAKSAKLPRTSVDTKITQRDGSVRTLTRKATKFNNWAMLSHLFEKGVAPHALGTGSSKRARGKTKINQHGAAHPGIPAQPHFLPSFFATKGAVASRFAALMKELIHKAQINATRAA